MHNPSRCFWNIIHNYFSLAVNSSEYGEDGRPGICILGLPSHPDFCASASHIHASHLRGG